MNLDPQVCYRALLARDERHDGRFFVCVKTTGIYCRPICPARPPRLENCEFVRTAAAAAEAGYRPCLRCKPERSPDAGFWLGTSATVSRGLRLIDAGALDQGSIEGLAIRLGVGPRHLRRLFNQHLGASPIAVAQTRRVLLAKQLIHDTDLSMTDVALASGFSSVRRFNETFHQLYNRPPAQLRRKNPRGVTPTSRIVLTLPYRPPYDWEAMLHFLAARAIPGVECVRNSRYHRTIEIDDSIGMISVQHQPSRSALRLMVTISCIKNLATIISRVRHLFDLHADPLAISTVLSQDPLLNRLVIARPGLRVPGAWDGFEVAVRAILGQQISVDLATKLAGKFVDRFGQPICDGSNSLELKRVFPRADCLELKGIESLGMPRKRAEAIISLAQAIQHTDGLLDPAENLEDAIEKLCRLPGIGHWTAQYIAMRVLRESDAFVAGDIALQRIMSINGSRLTSRQLLRRAEAWRPWRAYATLHLWTAESLPPSTNV